MSASLTYLAEPNPPSRVADLIVKEASALARIANHWSEPLCFIKGPEGSLVGCTKVSLPGYTAPDGAYVTVDPADDLFMMTQEIGLILRCLSTWAEAYKLAWHIKLEGAPVGNVDITGQYSDDLKSLLTELNEASGIPSDPESFKSRVSQLRAKYAGRMQ